jgi:hypothetical protein
MAAEGELIDVVLIERWPIWRVREEIEADVPQGWQLVDLYDVWLAGPPLVGRVAAADYRMTLRDSMDVAAVERAASALLAAPRLPRERAKGGGVVAYDLRPLLIGIDVRSGPPPVVRVRTRFHPELGTGRPDQVMAALSEAAGVAVEPASIVRERLLLAEDASWESGVVSRGPSRSRP